MTNNHQSSEIGSMESVIEKSLETLWSSAQESQHDPIKLLGILRRLEGLHQEIRDTLFQESLPGNRQALYVLLKDIEANGGWPYIYRAKLSELLRQLTQDDLDKLLPNERSQSSQ
ncbi:MAG: hypothetical protein NW224_08825 [Leptolyngbyaceae cyanobacterium bins.302]|nr:hypothetical protein [Leptolyngbyaceae cyanobacterium bins.302]